MNRGTGMKPRDFFQYLLILCCFVFSCSDDDNVINLELSSVKIGPYNLDLNNFENNLTAPTTDPIIASFSAPLDISSASKHIQLITELSGAMVPLSISFMDNDKTF